MIERGALRIAQVVQDRAGRADRRRPVGEPAAIEREQLEVIAQRAVGVVVGEDPVFEFGAGEARPGAIFAAEQRQIAGKQHLARAQVFERARHFRGRHFGDPELAGRDIHVRHAGLSVAARHRRQDSCSRASGPGSRPSRCPA